jgi:hypothetical protein
MWDSPSGSATAITPTTWNLIDGVFGFTSDQDDEYYLDAISYDLHGAIAECMEQLAMDQNKALSWSRGGVKYTHYDLTKRAMYHRSMSGLKSNLVVKTYRSNY